MPRNLCLATYIELWQTLIWFLKCRNSFTPAQFNQQESTNTILTSDFFIVLSQTARCVSTPTPFYTPVIKHRWMKKKKETNTFPLPYESESLDMSTAFKLLVLLFYFIYPQQNMKKTAHFHIWEAAKKKFNRLKNSGKNCFSFQALSNHYTHQHTHTHWP